MSRPSSWSRGHVLSHVLNRSVSFRAAGCSLNLPAKLEVKWQDLHVRFQLLVRNSYANKSICCWSQRSSSKPRCSTPNWGFNEAPRNPKLLLSDVSMAGMQLEVPAELQRLSPQPAGCYLKLWSFTSGSWCDTCTVFTVGNSSVNAEEQRAPEIKYLSDNGMFGLIVKMMLKQAERGKISLIIAENLGGIPNIPS